MGGRWGMVVGTGRKQSNGKAGLHQEQGGNVHIHSGIEHCMVAFSPFYTAGIERDTGRAGRRPHTRGRRVGAFTGACPRHTGMHGRGLLHIRLEEGK